MPLSNQYSIHDAAEAAGLTPSVIRVWEERYGWPSPKRHANGYRAFAAHEIEELKRAAVLVRDGMPIGKLIIDGFPVWPDEHKRTAVKQHDLTQTKSLPSRPGRLAEDLRATVLEGLNQLHGGYILECVQRACIELRPADEVAVVLAPALIGLIELQQYERAVSHDQDVRVSVASRSRQLRQRFPTSGNSVLVAPANESDGDFAALVIAALATRGINARLSEKADASIIASENVPTPGQRKATPGHPKQVHVTALPCEGCVPVARILDQSRSASEIVQLENAPALAS
jgi:DNA-binding transcriptional MerR regulator